jgi:hypothetical protein
MSHYPVLCTRGCQQLAQFKIAAQWSDGITTELKTYALACATCLADALEHAKQQQAACRLAPGETLSTPGVYEMRRGERDRTLTRRTDLECAPPA